MPLTDLFNLITSLRQTITDHAPQLQQSEALTRYALIDPLLRELGWDTADPGMVIPEYSIDVYNSGRIRADYALLSPENRKPIIMIEAKKLNEPLLQGNAINQGLNAAMNTATQFFAATNGDQWEIYDAFKPVTPPEKKIAAFHISQDDPERTMLSALALNRQNAAKSIVEPASAPLINAAAPVIAAPDPTPGVPANPLIDRPASEKWVRLDKIKYDPKDPKPLAALMPDGAYAPAKTAWTQAYKAIIDWLDAKNELTTMTIGSKSGKRNILAPKPAHPSGEPFKVSHQISRGYLDMNQSPRGLIANLHAIFESTNFEMSDFHILYPLSQTYANL